MDGLAAALTAATGYSSGPEKSKGPDNSRNSEHEAASPAEETRIRLQFTSPTKPALITGSARPGDESAPDYRYLVVPLRALAPA